MTLKQQVHELVEELPDNSPLLVEVRETLRMNHAIGEAMDDVREVRTFGAEEFMAKVAVLEEIEDRGELAAPKLRNTGKCGTPLRHAGKELGL